MYAFIGITGYEYRMGVRRWGLWLGCLLASLPSLSYPHLEADVSGSLPGVWQWRPRSRCCSIFSFPWWEA